MGTGKRVVLLAGALVLLISGVAAARGHASPHPTEIGIQSVYVGQDGRLSVSGVLHSHAQICRLFNTVALVQKRTSKDEILDVSFPSFVHSAWALRTARGAVVDNAQFYVKVSRVTEVRGRHGHHRRRTVCSGDRARVVLPPPGTPSSAPR